MVPRRRELQLWEKDMSGWDTTVVFGSGKQRGANVSGFHRQGNKGVFSGVVFRGDTRDPQHLWNWKDGLFKLGFQLHQAGVNVSGRQTSNIAQVNQQGGTTRGVVSASMSVKMAAYWAVHNKDEEGWVYCMYIENEEWAAEASMNLMGTEGRGPADVQQEIMFRALPGTCIYGARKAKRIGARGPRQTYLVGPMVANPGYTGGPQTYGVVYRDPNFQIFASAEQQVLCE